MCPRRLARYFYESTTGVYYDPRSKLYCKDMTWHSHTPGQNPAFTPVTQPQQQQGTDQQYPLVSDAAGGTAIGAAAGAATSAAVGGETGATASAPAATASGLKRATVGGWKKSSRLAFGFKSGAKLAKAGIGGGGLGASGVLGGADSESSEDENGGDGAGAAAAGTKGAAGVGGVGVGGSLAKKRQLQDVSKWNARKLEVRMIKSAGSSAYTAVLHHRARCSALARNLVGIIDGLQGTNQHPSVLRPICVSLRWVRSAFGR